MQRWTRMAWLTMVVTGGTGLAITLASAAPASERGVAAPRREVFASPACQELLASDFTWANQPAGSTISHLGATLTIHTPRDSDDDGNDYVLYAEGQLSPVGTGAQQVLRGTLAGHHNQTPNQVAVFAATSFRFEVTVTRTGQVTVQQKIGTTNFLGRGPEVYQAACTGGLLTAIPVQPHGARSHTLSLTQYGAPHIN